MSDSPAGHGPGDIDENGRPAGDGPAGDGEAPGAPRRLIGTPPPAKAHALLAGEPPGRPPAARELPADPPDPAKAKRAERKRRTRMARRPAN